MDNPVELKQINSLDKHQQDDQKDQKIQHLKSLLLKQKKQNDSLKHKIEQQESLIRENNESYLQNEQLLQSYLQEEKEEIKYQNIQKVLARIQVNSVNWLGIKYANKIKWIREENIKKDESDDLPFLVDYEEAVQLKQTQLEAKERDQNDLEMVIQQYEARISKIQNIYEETENKLAETLNQNKHKVKILEEQSAAVNRDISKMVDQSEEIMQSSYLYHNENGEKKNQYMEQIRLLSSQFQDAEFDYFEKELQFCKEHIMILHQTLNDNLEKISQLQQEIQSHEKKYQKLEKIYQNETEKLQQEKRDILESGRRKINEVNQQCETMKVEQFKINKENEIQIDFLQKELKKNINTQYIKNILIKFISGDVSIQEKTLPVITTVLQFNSQESEIFRNAWKQSKNPLQSTVSSLQMMFRK